MASELKVDKFTGITTAGSISVTGEGNSTTTNLQQGLCKAWGEFNASTSLQDNFNTTSLTDNGTGDTTIVIAANFSNALFSPNSSAGYASDNPANYGGGIANVDSGNARMKTTSQDSSSATDTAFQAYQLFGDLA